ncbi:MAG: acriflavine resistance protein B [Nitrospirales bacterium]|nr:MAG: acriflavine resistance protein B [Nitrospirales bacterium]
MSNTASHTTPNRHQKDREEHQPSAFARFFLLRTTFGLLLALLLGIGGFMAYGLLVKEALPDLEIPQATITTEWPGADPQSIEQEITTKIEKEIKSIKGLKTITSASFDSFSIIAVEFEANANLNESMQLLRARVSDAEAEIPREAEDPTIEQISVDDRPILSVVLYGKVSDAVLSRVSEDLQDRLERVLGVNEVTLGGAREEVVHIRLDPGRLLALGISPVQIREAVQNANVDMPWGEIDSEEIGASVRLLGRFRNVEELQRLPIKRLENDPGRVIRLNELGRIYRGLEKENTRAQFSWLSSPYESSVEISVKKVPGADTIKVIEAVVAELKDAEKSRIWAPKLRYRITQDESKQILNSLNDVLMNGLQAMAAVFLILFVLLTWREGLIAGLSIPLTFLGALLIVWLLDYTLNELVIIGMILALGLLVDVFILMMEGVHEGIFIEHLSFNEAVLKTAKRYALPAAAGQATTILALAPLMAISGVAGEFIRVLPVTAIVCLVMAFAVALLVALPLSRFLLGGVAEKSGEERMTRVDRITQKVTDNLRDWSLRTTLRSRRTAGLWIAGATGIFVLSLVAFMQVPVIMYPKSDGLKLGITVELPPMTSLSSSQNVADRLGAILREKDYLENVVKLIGKKSPMAQVSIGDALRPTIAENFVGFSALFVPREQREKPGYVYAEKLRHELKAVLDEHHAGATLVVVPETGQPSAGEAVQIDLVGQDMEILQSISRSVQMTLRTIEGTSDVRDNLGNVRPEINMIPKREVIDFYGLSQQELAEQVRYAMASDKIGDFVLGGTEEDIPIKLGMDWPSQAGDIGGPTQIEELAMIKAFTPQGKTVPLLAMLERRVGTAPVSITHKNGRRTITVLSKAEGRAATDIVSDIRPKLADMQKSWPHGYTYGFAGEAQETAETFSSAGNMLIVAIVLIFGVLVLLFGTFGQSFILLCTIPLALIGTFLGFAAFSIPFSFFAMVGVISLIGIVANDAIVMVDTMNRHLKDGIEVAIAAARGASDRLRPILSTSLTTIVGLVPLAFSNPMWRPLCYAVIFGLFASTILSLLIVPCLYVLFTRKPSEQEQLTALKQTEKETIHA